MKYYKVNTQRNVVFRIDDDDNSSFVYLQNSPRDKKDLVWYPTKGWHCSNIRRGKEITEEEAFLELL